VVHQSDSSVQLAAEAKILKVLQATFGPGLKEDTVLLDDTAPVQVDAVSPKKTVFIEIFAHQGLLKSGQKRKVALDALKLITIGREHPGAELVIALADDAAAASLKSDSWLAVALRAWNVKVVVVTLTDDTRAQLRNAQVQQKMDNAGVAGQVGVTRHELGVAAIRLV
jgi:hypothetical protein